jgi:hypothetical protein
MPAADGLIAGSTSLGSSVCLVGNAGQLKKPGAGSKETT